MRAARKTALAAFFCALALATGSAAWAQDRVEVTAQRLDGFARVIVTFPERLSLPAYRVNNENGVLSLIFEEPIAGNLPDIPLALAEYVAVARIDPGQTGIRIGLRGPFQINKIEAGEELYIDLLPANWVGLPPGLPPEVVERLAERSEEAARLAEERRRAELAAEYNPVASVRVGRHPTFSRIVFDWNVGTTAKFSREAQSGAIEFDWPVGIDLYEVLSDMPGEIVSATNDPRPGSSVVHIELAEGADMRFYEETPTRFVLDVDRIGAVSGGIDPASLLPDEEIVAEQEPDIGSVAVADVAQESIVPTIDNVGATVRMVFPFAEDTPAAVYKRGDTVWMLFDTTVRISSPENADALAPVASNFAVMGAGSAQIVRMEVNSDRLATLGSEGRSWVLSLGDVLLDATEPVVLDRRRGVDGRFEMIADLGRPSRVHHLRDPDVGDILEVVTAYPPARGVVRDLEYVDFSAPRSIHGLVIRPHSDALNVSIADRVAVISSERGLTLSASVDRRFRNPDAGGGVSAMDLGSVMAANPNDFQDRLEEIVSRTASSEGRELDRARLDLARFYLGNNLSHEALGVLAVMQEGLRQPDLEPALAVTRAAANVLIGRPSEAMDGLNSDALRDDADTMIWRAIARTQLRDYAGARLDALGAEEVVDHYPNWVRNRFHLAGLLAAVESEDMVLATRMLNRVDLGALSSEQISTFELLGGRLDELNGRFQEALESYGRVIVADHRMTAPEAVLRTIQLLDEMGRLDVGRAAETLSVQSTLWRGDYTEVEMVALMTDLQFRNGDYRDAFTTVRALATSHEDSPALATMVERARTEFASLYLHGAADGLDPIDALSIYYDFRHLTPAGTQGDLMIRNLAQRLIKVDLLAQAAELLEYQVDNRLQGAARAQVAADLAVVHIANRKPAEALSALSRTRLAGLPPALDRQRRVLEARALIDAQRQDLALDILTNVAGRDTDLLRIDALWRGQRFREAGELIETLYAADLGRGRLSPVARSNVIKAAVGYVMADDQIGLSRLRSKFSGLMAETPEWPMFAFVTDTVDTAGREFRDVARQIAAVDSLNAFLNAYRELYAADNSITPLRASGESAG